jgi:hypothetical protein
MMKCYKKVDRNINTYLGRIYLAFFLFVVFSTITGSLSRQRMNMTNGTE